MTNSATKVYLNVFNVETDKSRQRMAVTKETGGSKFLTPRKEGTIINHEIFHNSGWPFSGLVAMWSGVKIIVSSSRHLNVCLCQMINLMEMIASFDRNIRFQAI